MKTNCNRSLLPWSFVYLRFSYNRWVFFFYTLGCVCFVLFIVWFFFFFSSERWFCFIVICVKSFELVVFIDSECDFICFGFYFIVWKSVVLKISITLSLENRNTLKPKYTETDSFPAISIGFGWEFHKPKYSVSVGHTHTNRPKPNRAHPTLYPLIFQDSSATSDNRKFWNYTWNSAISMEMTQPCYYWHFRPSETKAQMDLRHC